MEKEAGVSNLNGFAARGHGGEAGVGAALRSACGMPTWVGVKLALHGLADALQLHCLQRLIHVQEGGQAAQRVLHQVGHFPDVEELQQLRVHGGEGAQEHGLQERNAGQPPARSQQRAVRHQGGPAPQLRG